MKPQIQNSSLRLILLALILMVESGCSHHHSQFQEQEYERLVSLLSYERILESLQQICPAAHDSPWEEFLHQTKVRLASADPQTVPLKESEILLLTCRKAISFAAPPDLMIISTEMLSLLPSESALAFLIAHELAHIALEHISIGDSARLEFQRAQEREADRFALELLISAHYNPWTAIEIFSNKRLFSQVKWHLSPTHPDLEERKKLLEDVIRASDSLPSATTSSREFLRLKKIALP